MSVFVDSDDLPFVFELKAIDIGDARDLVERWMRESYVFRIEAGDASPDEVPELHGMPLVNFGALLMVVVTEDESMLDPSKVRFPMTFHDDAE